MKIPRAMPPLSAAIYKKLTSLQHEEYQSIQSSLRDILKEIFKHGLTFVGSSHWKVDDTNEMIDEYAMYWVHNQMGIVLRIDVSLKYKRIGISDFYNYHFFDAELKNRSAQNNSGIPLYVDGYDSVYPEGFVFDNIINSNQGTMLSTWAACSPKLFPIEHQATASFSDEIGKDIENVEFDFENKVLQSSVFPLLVNIIQPATPLVISELSSPTITIQ